MGDALTLDGREKRRKKKIIETSKDRFERDTIDLAEASERGNFKSERKFANEIMDTVRSLDLPLRLDRITKNDAYSFIIAILQQLRSQRIYQSLGEEKKKLADEMCVEKFRTDRKSTRLNSSHSQQSRMPSSA